MKAPRCSIRGLPSVLYFAQLVDALKLLESSSLVPCSNNSVIKTNNFKMTLTPGNDSLTIKFDGEINYSGKITMDVELLAYGYSFLTMQVDPCDYNLSGFCPMTPENMTVPYATLSLSKNVISEIPSITYTVPDLDAIVRVNMVSKSTNQSITCIKARVMNTTTVYQAAVPWTLAVITGLSLFASPILSILGYTNIATQVSFRTILFLGFMQSQAMAGLTAVEFTPLIQNWSQNFQWTLAIVHTDFLNTLTTWFQRATGGTTSHLSSGARDFSIGLLKRSAEMFEKRREPTSDGGAEVLLHGIIRMGYRAGIESTNIFMTGYLVFYIVAIIIFLSIMALKFGLSAIWNKSDRAKSLNISGAKDDWRNFMRENFCRIALLGYPQICVFSIWELDRRDSTAEVVLAITIWLAMTIILGIGSFRIFQHGRSSRHFNETQTYSLSFDGACLTKWACLYVHYRAEAYYFIIPLLLYTVLKGMIIAFAQQSPTVQAIFLLLFEAGFTVATAVIRPYRDKQANSFAITAAVINLTNAIFILTFTNVFNQPDLMTGIMAVLFFFYNALFTLILAIFLLIGLFYASQLKEPAPGREHFGYNRASVQSTARLIQHEDRGTIELLPLQEVTRTEELLKLQHPHSISARNVKQSSRPYGDKSNRSPSESCWNLDHGHDGGIYNVRYSAAPPSPFADPVEPTLPLVPSSSGLHK